MSGWPAAVLVGLVLASCASHRRSAAIPGGDEPAVRAWPVMGTMLEVTVWEQDSARARRALTAARAAVQEVDRLMSNYRPESELSAVNRRAGSDSITTISPETADVLDAALSVAGLTGGALDVTVGPVVDVWGFYRPEGALPPAAALDSARALVGYRRIEYDRDARAVRLPDAGMRLDFGAIAKGYAVDRAIEALRAAGMERGMVDLGGNLRVLGAPPGTEGWPIGLRDPRSPAAVLAVVRLDSGAVATSGDYERFFVHQGVRYSHIIDPRTGWPARGVAGVSVVAPSGLQSDALSTALFVLGPERGCDVARAAGVEALWVLDAATRGGAIRVTPGLMGRVELRGPAGTTQPRPCG